MVIFRERWSTTGVLGSADIYVIKEDGTGLMNISNAGGVDSGPDWGP
jgi:hypothetical protein